MRRPGSSLESVKAVVGSEMFCHGLLKAYREINNGSYTLAVALGNRLAMKGDEGEEKSEWSTVVRLLEWRELGFTRLDAGRDCLFLGLQKFVGAGHVEGYRHAELCRVLNFLC